MPSSQASRRAPTRSPCLLALGADDDVFVIAGSPEDPARAGPRHADGIVVLDDSRAPRVLHLDGAYRLSTELRTAGTSPQVARGRRLCTYQDVP
jgi:hypothetical protein